MIDLLKAGYGAQSVLSDLVRDMAYALAQRVACFAIKIYIHGFGELTLQRVEGEIRSTWVDQETSPMSVRGVGQTSNGSETSSELGTTPWGQILEEHHVGVTHAVVNFPVEYAGVEIGAICVVASAEQAWMKQHGHLIRMFARRCAHLAMRYRVKNWIERRVGRPLLLIGISATLFELELFVEQACRSTLPVLLTGEFGTEKALLAASIHSSGTRAIGPFVEVTVSSPELLPAQWFDRARGGTLFLNGIDELTSEQQSKLSQCLPSRLGQWFTTNGAQEVRLIASTTQDLRKLVSEGKFSRALLAELDFLSATVPPLRERREDIPYHVYSLLERSGWLTTPECQEMLLDACCRHSWPENLFELEQMIVRLAVMTNGRVIDEVDLRRYAPALPKSRSPSTLIDESAGAAEGASTDMRSQLEHWVRCALSGNVDALSRLHGGLKKALLYIGEHYADPISLADLAHNAHLSQSHLSFLFRTVLGASFKSVLSAIRLEQAKLSLKTDPLARITEVAHSVGYGDLSHFERSFRRVVGKTPREYRQSVSLNSAYDAIGPLTNGRVATAPA